MGTHIDEGLPYDHREDITIKVLDLCKTGECFTLLGEKGLGKSKYLRHIANSETFRQHYLTDLNIEFNYVNLNEIYTLSLDQFLKTLLSTKSAQSLNEIEEYLANLKGKYYLILDQAELLPKLDEEIHRILTSLIVKFKRKFAVIISANHVDYKNIESLEYIDQHTTAKIIFTPQSLEQVTNTVKQFEQIYGLNLGEQQRLLVAQKSKGTPLFVKQVLIEIKAGTSFEQAILKFTQKSTGDFEAKKISLSPTEIIAQPNGDSLKEFRKFFTRNQYLFFVELLKHKDQIVDRNELAIILSPESEGSGVSNNAVDQTINRLRQVIIDEKLPYQIISKRGVGYLMKGNQG